MKRLLIFGDSWSFGVELNPGEKTFGQLLAEKYQCPWHNFSRPATSIPHLVQQLRRAYWNSLYPETSFDIQGSTALFFLTSPERDITWEDGNEIEIQPYIEKPYTKAWYSLIYSTELSTYRVNTTVLALKSLCRTYEINDYYLWGWEKVDLWEEVDRGKFYRHGKSSALEMFDDHIEQKTLWEYSQAPNKYIYPNINKHPNQAGHQLIAKKLYQWLSNLNH